MNSQDKMPSRAGLTESEAEKRVPYRHPQPEHSPPELVIPDTIPTDERLWVPQAENVWFRPLCLSATRGYWQNLLRVRKSGVLSRHRHPQPVHGFVLKGEWHYLEHDWIATAGSFVYETPGEGHTLVSYEHPDPMRVFFIVKGPLIWLDEKGGSCGHFDVHDYIALCREHYEKVGIGAAHVDTLFR